MSVAQPQVVERHAGRGRMTGHHLAGQVGTGEQADRGRIVTAQASR